MIALRFHLPAGSLGFPKILGGNMGVGGCGCVWVLVWVWVVIW